MGREIWIYKLEDRKVKPGLQELMNDGFGFSYPFKNFIIDRQKEKILDSLPESTALITPELLFEIAFWLSEEIGLKDKELNDFMTAKLGISLIYESSTKSEANGFMIFYHNYLDLVQKKIESTKIYESGIITSSHEFVDFLDYFILFLNEVDGMIDTKKNNPYTDEINSVIDGIATEKMNDSNFRSLFNSEIEKFRDLIKIPEHKNQRYFPEVELVNRNNEFLVKSLNMKIQLKEEHEKVVIVDSI